MSAKGIKQRIVADFDFQEQVHLCEIVHLEHWEIAESQGPIAKAKRPDLAARPEELPPEPLTNTQAG